MVHQPEICIISPIRQMLTAPKGGIFLILSYIRTILLYLVLILVIRLMGKRQIGQWSQRSSW